MTCLIFWAAKIIWNVVNPEMRIELNNIEPNISSLNSDMKNQIVKLAAQQYCFALQ